MELRYFRQRYAMTRFQYILKAKDGYSIQSPFVYDLYYNVLTARLDKECMRMNHLSGRDIHSQLLYKILDHYNAREIEDTDTWLSTDKTIVMPDGSMIGLLYAPHSDKEREKLWEEIWRNHEVTVSVDIYHTGIIFSSKKLSKQHFLLR